jgi:hypothetical protein
MTDALEPDPELAVFIDNVIVPILVQRLLAEKEVHGGHEAIDEGGGATHEESVGVAA